jgi:hypothetical protein
MQSEYGSLEELQTAIPCLGQEPDLFLRRVCLSEVKIGREMALNVTDLLSGGSPQNIPCLQDKLHCPLVVVPSRAVKHDK